MSWAEPAKKIIFIIRADSSWRELFTSVVELSWVDLNSDSLWQLKSKQANYKKLTKPKRYLQVRSGDDTLQPPQVRSGLNCLAIKRGIRNRNAEFIFNCAERGSGIRTYVDVECGIHSQHAERGCGMWNRVRYSNAERGTKLSSVSAETFSVTRFVSRFEKKCIN